MLALACHQQRRGPIPLRWPPHRLRPASVAPPSSSTLLSLHLGACMQPQLQPLQGLQQSTPHNWALQRHASLLRQVPATNHRPSGHAATAPLLAGLSRKQNLRGDPRAGIQTSCLWYVVWPGEAASPLARSPQGCPLHPQGCASRTAHLVVAVADLVASVVHAAWPGNRQRTHSVRSIEQSRKACVRKCSSSTHAHGMHRTPTPIGSGGGGAARPARTCR